MSFVKSQHTGFKGKVTCWYGIVGGCLGEGGTIVVGGVVWGGW